MLLSIIVPVYNMNKGNILRSCIESLLVQTVTELGPYEIILIDDRSTDDSLTVLKEYQERYPEMVKVIERKINGRQGAARNDGIRAAKGKWIGFVDADDRIDRDMYFKLVKRADETDADCATCNSMRIWGDEIDCFPGSGSREVNKTNFVEGNIDTVQIERAICKGEDMWNKIYLRRMFIDNDIFFPEHIFYEDNAVAPFFYILSRKIAVVNEPLYYYFFNPDSTCNNMSKRKIEDRVKAGEFFIETALRLGVYDEYKQIFECGLFNSVYVRGIPHVWGIICSFRERLELLKSIRAIMKQNIGDVTHNKLIGKYFPGQIRGYSLLIRSLWLYVLYHYFREYKGKLGISL